MQHDNTSRSIFLLRAHLARVQVQGEAAYDLLWGKVKAQGIGALYAGAGANFAASWAGKSTELMCPRSLPA
jgi:hypothetical protein